jgi:NapC/NirT cytochrome c family, N-terminal region
MNPFEESVKAASNGGLSLVAWIVIVVSVICIILIITIMRKDPEKVSETFGKRRLLIVFFVLSPIAYLLSFSSAIEDSKTVEFCHSCHVMHGYIKDLKDPDSEYLASEHYQHRWISENQCFTCHSDYGLFGNMKAKMTGIRHVWKYYTGYETPVKLYGTYNNGICLRCHAPVLDFQNEAEHEKHAADILSNKMSCLGMDCHVRPHPEEAWKEK